MQFPRLHNICNFSSVNPVDPVYGESQVKNRNHIYNSCK